MMSLLTAVFAIVGFLLLPVLAMAAVLLVARQERNGKR